MKFVGVRTDHDDSKMNFTKFRKLSYQAVILRQFSFYNSARFDISEVSYASKIIYTSVILNTSTATGFLLSSKGRYFKSYFSDKSALDEKGIMTELSQDLRADITEYLFPERKIVTGDGWCMYASAIRTRMNNNE